MTMAFDFPAAPTEGQMFAPPGGPLYVYNAPVWKVAGITSVPGEWVINEIIVTTTQTYTKPANLAYLEVEGLGPGGAGAGVLTSAAGQYAAGGGGGAGAPGWRLFAASELPASLTITIGAPGGGIATPPGPSGGTSSFGSLITLGGGIGGNGAAGATTIPTAGSGGGGGAASGATINGVGMSGTSGIAFYATNRSLRGAGASSAFGGGGRDALTTNVAGEIATGYGAGGSGACNSAASLGLAAGGPGTPSFFRLREYFPAWVLDAAYAPGTVRETLVTATGPYVKPAGLKFLEVEGVAPGGASGGPAVTAAGNASGSGGAGAGAWGKRLFAASELGASETITVGAPGVGASGTIGSSGGQSSFGTTFNCTLGGGIATNRVASITVATASPGGVGGAPGAGWQVSCTGEEGAGAVVFWNSTYSQRPNGGNAHPFGKSAPTRLVTGANAESGFGYGAGGCGVCHSNVGAATAGTDGQPAMFILKEYF